MFTLDVSSFSVSTNRNKILSNSVIQLPHLDNLQSYLQDHFGIAKNSYYIVSNGRKVNLSEDKFANGSTILRIIPRILGGKGGFGSMLRAIGAQIEKTTNREACRDLSGRRLRDINEEQRLKNWISQQAEREREAAERKKKKLERLCQEPKHDFKDDKYDESRSNMSEVMSSSIDQGFKASTSGTSNNLKRKTTEKPIKKTQKKKKKLWIDCEESENSSDESNDSGKECEKDTDKVVSVQTDGTSQKRDADATT